MVTHLPAMVTQGGLDRSAAQVRVSGAAENLRSGLGLDGSVPIGLRPTRKPGITAGMMPVIRQRAAIVVGLLLAGACYAMIARSALAEGAVGLTLVGGTTGIQPLLLLIGLSLPVIAIALIAAAMGNPLVGPLIVSGGLVAAASLGGSIDGWLRSIESPATFWLLAGETIIWAGVVIAARLAVRAGWPRVRAMLPGPIRHAYCRELDEPTDGPAQQAGIAAGCVLGAIGVVFALLNWLLIDFVTILVIALALVSLAWFVSMTVSTKLSGSGESPGARASLAPAFLGGIVTTAVGAGLLTLLQQSPDTGQVIGAMLVAFTAAALLAHQLYPTRARLPMLLSPLCVAVATYAWMALSNASADQVLLRYFTVYSKVAPSAVMPLPPLALALPVFYASAGVAGVCIGIGWSQALHANTERHVIVTT